MEKVTNYLTGFFGGLMAVMMSILPVTIIWYVLTGGDVWGMDVITNLTNLVNMFGNGGFTGLVVLVMFQIYSKQNSQDFLIDKSTLMESSLR